MITNILLSAVPMIPIYLGVYLLFLMRSDLDLTVAGSYGVSSAITAMMLVNGASVYLTMAYSVLAAGLLGLVTAAIHSRLRIPVFLAGLVMSIALYSVALRIMDKQPTVSLVGAKTLISPADGLTGDAYYYAVISIFAVVVLVVLAVVGMFLKTEIGLALRASGINTLMARSNGFNDKRGVAIALFIGNALAGVSGTLVVQSQTFATATQSQTVVISALGAVVVGTFIARPTNSKIFRMLIAVTLGTLIYQAIIVIALKLGLDPADLNLVTAVALLAAIAIQIGLRKTYAASRKRTTADFQIMRDDLVSDLVRSLTGKD